MINRLALATALGALAFTPAFAATMPSAPVAAPLSPQDQALVQKASAYLENLSTVAGRFTQTNPRGGAADGTFYLQRPGKARLDYDAPSGVTVASDGRAVTAVDRRLKTIQRVPLGFTPFALFLARNIRLDKGVTITGVNHTAQGFSLTAQRGHKATRGQIALSFSVAPLVLRGWALTEPQGGTTTVVLSNLAPAAAHPMAFFQPVLPPSAPPPDEP